MCESVGQMILNEGHSETVLLDRSFEENGKKKQNKILLEGKKTKVPQDIKSSASTFKNIKACIDRTCFFPLKIHSDSCYVVMLTVYQKS